MGGWVETGGFIGGVGFPYLPFPTYLPPQCNTCHCHHPALPYQPACLPATFFFPHLPFYLPPFHLPIPPPHHTYHHLPSLPFVGGCWVPISPTSSTRLFLPFRCNAVCCAFAFYAAAGAFRMCDVRFMWFCLSSRSRHLCGTFSPFWHLHLASSTFVVYLLPSSAAALRVCVPAGRLNGSFPYRFVASPPFLAAPALPRLRLPAFFTLAAAILSARRRFALLHTRTRHTYHRASLTTLHNVLLPSTIAAPLLCGWFS